MDVVLFRPAQLLDFKAACFIGTAFRDRLRFIPVSSRTPATPRQTIHVFSPD
jgi:hypothetical protein